MGGTAAVQGAISAPKPSHITNQVWNEALARNPDPNELLPAALVGASSLHSRIVSQQERANALASHATKLRETCAFLEKTARSSREGIRHLDLEQEALRRRLLEVMRKVEIVRCMGQPTQRAEVEASQRLENILKSVNTVGKGLMELEERGRLQARAWRTRAQSNNMNGGMLGSTSEEATTLGEQDKAALFSVLNDQRMGMERLGDIVKRDVRDAGILKEELSRSSTRTRALPVSGGAAIFGGR
jgi:nuclear pore complex protein Nup54